MDLRKLSVGFWTKGVGEDQDRFAWIYVIGEVIKHPLGPELQTFGVDQAGIHQWAGEAAESLGRNVPHGFGRALVEDATWLLRNFTKCDLKGFGASKAAIACLTEGILAEWDTSAEGVGRKA